tara:strand:+ start:2179 stop:8727 length:6549 start_codon:yes stop_codon:yes gene_type:complete
MPTYDIEAPNGKVFNIEAPEGATDEQLFGYVQQLLNQPTPIDPKEEGTALTRALPRGIDTGQMMLGSAVEGLGALTGIESLQQYGADVSERNKAELGAQEAGATRLKDIKEAEGVLDTASETASFTGSALGETLPMSGAVVAGSLIGGKAGAAFGGLPGAAIGSVAGGFAANYPFIYGENVEAQKEAVAQGLKPEVDYATAALYAIPATALDTIATLFSFGLAKLGGGVGKQIMDEALQSGGVFSRGVKNAVAGTVTEVPTEVGQEIISRYQSGQSIDSPEAIDSYLEVGAAALAVGSSIRATTGVVQGRYVSPEDRKAKDEKIIREGEARVAAQRSELAGQRKKSKKEAQVAGLNEDSASLDEKIKAANKERIEHESKKVKPGKEGYSLWLNKYKKIGAKRKKLEQRKTAIAKKLFRLETADSSIGPSAGESTMPLVGPSIPTAGAVDPAATEAVDPAATPTEQSVVGDTIELYDENGDSYTSTVVKVSKKENYKDPKTGKIQKIGGGRIVLDKNKKEVLIDTVGAQAINPKADNYVLQGKGSKFREATNNKININELTLDELKAASKVQQEMYKSVPNEGMGAMALQDLIAIKNRVDILTKQQAATPKTSAATEAVDPAATTEVVDLTTDVGTRFSTRKKEPKEESSETRLRNAIKANEAELFAMGEDPISDPNAPAWAVEAFDESRRAEGRLDDLQKYFNAQEYLKNSYEALEKTQSKDDAIKYLAADIHLAGDLASEEEPAAPTIIEEGVEKLNLSEPSQFGEVLPKANNREGLDIGKLRYFPYTGGVFGLNYYNSLNLTDQKKVLQEVNKLRAESISGRKDIKRNFETDGGTRLTKTRAKRLDTLQGEKRTPEEDIELDYLMTLRQGLEKDGYEKIEALEKRKRERGLTLEEEKQLDNLITRKEITDRDSLQADVIQSEVSEERAKRIAAATEKLQDIEAANRDKAARAQIAIDDLAKKEKSEAKKARAKERRAELAEGRKTAKAAEAAEAAEKSTPTTVVEALIDKFGVSVTKRIEVVESVAQIDNTNLSTEEQSDLANAPSDTQGVYISGKVYLFSDNIKRGEELAVFLHEVGIHAGMQNAVGRGNYQFLINKVREFADSKEDSVESKIAKRALARVAEAGVTRAQKTKQEQNDELLAFFVEEAVSGGIIPATKAKEPTKLGIWFKRFISGIKRYLRVFGLSITDTNFNAQDFVDMAYGAAKKELRAPTTSSVEDLVRFSTAGIGLDETTELFGLNDDVESDPTRLERTIEKAEGLPIMRTIRKFLYDSLSFYQLQDIVRRYNPELADKIQTLEYIAAKRRKAIDDNRRAFTEAIVLNTRLEEAYIAESGISKADLKILKEQFGDIAHMSSILGVDLRLTGKELSDSIAAFSEEDIQQAVRLIQRFNSLPENFKSIYQNMANVYEVAGNRLLVFQEEELGKLPTSGQKLAQKLTGGRIVPYFPLMRTGEYWIKVQKGSDPEETHAYETTSDAKEAIRNFKKAGFTVTQSIISKGAKSVALDEGSVGVYQNVLKMLYEANTPKNEQNVALIEQVTESYLSMFPANSLKQQFKKRGNVPGYNNDVFANFATMGLKLANELAIVETAQDFNNAVGAIDTETRYEGSGTATAIDSVLGRVSFLRNPQPQPFAGKLSYLGYNAFLAGNISSAIVNLTQLFIVTFPKLYAEFGLVGAIAEMTKAMGNYIANASNATRGRDNNTSLTVPGLGWNLSDVTLFTEEAMTKEPALRKLYDASLERAGIRRTTSQELQDARRGEGAFRLGGTLQRSELALNWAFQNSERANREVGIMAAYRLGMEKYDDADIAIDRALKITEEASGSALAELGPAYFQDGWGKVIGTFKRFVFSQVYLQYKLLRDALGYVFPKGYIEDSSLPMDPATGKRVDARKLAVRQLTMITTASFIFSGARGVPLYGVFEMIFDLSQDLGDDEDDFVDTNTIVKGVVGDMAFRGPLSYYLNIDLASRVGFYGLLGRQDSRKLEELGPVYYVVDTLGGPVLAYTNNVVRGIGAMSDSTRQQPILDGVQTILPAAFRNGFKAIRFGMEGATNKRGVPIIKDFNAYNLAMQAFGFTPATLTDKYEDNTFVGNAVRKMNEQKQSLLNRRFYAYAERDFAEIRRIDKKIREFNKLTLVKNSGNKIKASTKNTSIKNKVKANRDSVDGMSINVKQSKAARDLYNLNNE